MKTIDSVVKIMSYSEPEAFPKCLEYHLLYDHDSKWSHNTNKFKTILNLVIMQMMIFVREEQRWMTRSLGLLASSGRGYSATRLDSGLCRSRVPERDVEISRTRVLLAYSM